MAYAVNQPSQGLGPDFLRRDGNAGQLGASERIILTVIESDDGNAFGDVISPVDKSSAKQISHPIIGTNPRSDPTLNSSYHRFDLAGENNLFIFQMGRRKRHGVGRVVLQSQPIQRTDIV